MEEPGTWGTLTTVNSSSPETFIRTKIPSALGDYRGFYANVRDVILRRSELLVPPEAGYRSIRLLELAIRLSHERRTVEVQF